MHLVDYLGLLHEAEDGLARGFGLVADGLADDPDVYFLCHRMADESAHHSRELKQFADRYGEKRLSEPQRLEVSLFEDVRPGGLGLLRDLQDLYMMAHFCQITWMMIGQAAQGARNEELFTLAVSCESEITRQIKWLNTRMKSAAPMALLIAD